MNHRKYRTCVPVEEPLPAQGLKKGRFYSAKSFAIGTLTTLLLLCMASCKKAPSPPPKAHSVEVTKPFVCDVPVYVDYIGHMVAKRNVEVMAQVSGLLTAQYFEEGQEVKKGDLLLVIDPRPFEAALAKAEATVAQTYATLHYDRETTVRYAPLVQQDFISQLNYDQYITNVLVDEAVVAQNKASLQTAKINLGYCYITAPMDCVTGKLQVKTGNYVDANSNTQLTLLNQIQPILVDFYIPETDLFTIQQKQRKAHLKLIVYPDAAHKHSFEGELTLIDNQVNTGTGAILLEGTLPNQEKALWPGHFVDVRLILEQEKGALLLPSDAVMIGQKGHYVYTVKPDSTIEVRNVKVGQVYEDKYTSIKSGITVNDTIVTQGQLNLYPGMKVQVKNLRMEQTRSLDHEKE
jgi:multidrug efflux system membrane fusion protein